MRKFDSINLTIVAVVYLFINAIFANLIADCLTIFIPKPDILLQTEKFALMTRRNLTKKTATKSRFRIN